MIDIQDAYNSYQNAIRLHLAQMKTLQNVSNVIIYDVGSDERYDPTLISRRVYQTPNYADVVMVACGVSGIWEEIPLGKVMLPLPTVIAVLRNDWGITS